MSSCCMVTPPQKHDADGIGTAVPRYCTTGVDYPNSGKSPVPFQHPADSCQSSLARRRMDHNYHIIHVIWFLRNQIVPDILRHHPLQAATIFLPMPIFPFQTSTQGFQMEKVCLQSGNSRASAALVRAVLPLVSRTRHISHTYCTDSSCLDIRRVRLSQCSPEHSLL